MTEQTTLAPIEKAQLEDILRLKARIKDNWSLCQLFEGTPAAAEAEAMVAQTFRAAVISQEKWGEPFSFRGAGVSACHGGGLADNRSAYDMLLDKGYFVEEQREGKTVIFITQKLVEFLDAFFVRKDARA